MSATAMTDEPTILQALLTGQHPTISFCTCQAVSKPVTACPMHGEYFRKLDADKRG